jgi:TRAP-type transport system periplasmic protein
MKERWSEQKVVSILLCLMMSSLLLWSNHAAAAPLELKFASISAPAHVLNAQVHTPWIKQIEEASQGKLKVTLYTGAALGPAKQAYDLVAKGIADISYGWITFHPNRFPLSEVYTLPGLVPNRRSAYHLWDVYQEYLKPEWTKTKTLWLGLAPGYVFIMRDKPIRAISDVKGLRLGFMGGVAAKVISAMGGVPVDVTAQDAYTALQRKTIDGYINTWSSSAANKYGEIAKYYTNAGLFNSMFFCVMNLEAYKSLPLDVQKIIDENTGQKMFKSATDAYWDDDLSAEKTVVQQTGGKGVVYNLPKEETQKYRDLVKPIWEEWIKNVESRKAPGKKVLDAVVGFME